MIDLAGEDHLPLFSSSPDNSFHFVAQSAGADQQKANATIIRQQSDRFGQSQHAMPGPERTDETGERFIVCDAVLATNCRATNSGPKLLGINSVRIDNDLFVRHANAQQVAPLNL